MKRALAQFLLRLADSLYKKRDETSLPPLPASTDVPPWTVENAVAHRAYLSTPAGQAFMARMVSTAAAIAINGARNTTSTIHAAGNSTGWDEAVRTMIQLSRVSGVQDTNQNDETPRGETELLEQLSP